MGGFIDLINSIVNAEEASPYWFFTPLFSVYLSICLISAIPVQKRKKLFVGISVAWFLLNSLLPFANNVFQIGLRIPKYLIIGSDHLFYCIVGYLLNRYEIKKPRVRLGIYLLGVLGLAAHATGTYVLSVRAGSIVSTYKGYLNVPCVLYSVAIFVFVQQLAQRLRSAAFWKAAYVLKDYTFALYLIHRFIIKNLFLGILNVNITTLYYRLGAPVLILVMTMAITWFVRKMPVVRRVLPK